MSEVKPSSREIIARFRECVKSARLPLCTKCRKKNIKTWKELLKIWGNIEPI